MCGRNIGSLLFPLVVAGIQINEPVRQVAVSTLQATCPKCHSKVSSSFEWCPQCGYGLKHRACAYCGNQMEGDARFCPSCGAPGGKR